MMNVGCEHDCDAVEGCGNIRINDRNLFDLKPERFTEGVGKEQNRQHEQGDSSEQQPAPA